MCGAKLWRNVTRLGFGSSFTCRFPQLLLQKSLKKQTTKPEVKGAEATRSAWGAQCAWSQGRSQELDAALPPLWIGRNSLEAHGFEVSKPKSESGKRGLISPLLHPCTSRAVRNLWSPCKCLGDINFMFSYIFQGASEGVYCVQGNTCWKYFFFGV